MRHTFAKGDRVRFTGEAQNRLTRDSGGRTVVLVLPAGEESPVHHPQLVWVDGDETGYSGYWFEPITKEISHHPV